MTCLKDRNSKDIEYKDNTVKRAEFYMELCSSDTPFTPINMLVYDSAVPEGTKDVCTFALEYMKQENGIFGGCF